MYHLDPTVDRRWTREGLIQEVEGAGFTVQLINRSTDKIKSVMNLAASDLQLFEDGISTGIHRFLNRIFIYGINCAMAIVK